MTQYILGYLEPYISGFLISASLMFSIGPQNTFLIRHGLARKFVAQIVGICILGDIVLIGLGVFGVADLLQHYRYPALILGTVGIIFLLSLSYTYFKNALTIDEHIDARGRISNNLTKVIIHALALTFVNPASFIDTVVIIGGVAMKYSETASLIAYFVGAITASTICFSAIGVFTKYLYPFFKNALAWKILDIVAGTAMLIISVIIAVNLYQKFYI